MNETRKVKELTISASVHFLCAVSRLRLPCQRDCQYSIVSYFPLALLLRSVGDIPGADVSAT
jgi:hypothetical protein